MSFRLLRVTCVAFAMAITPGCVSDPAKAPAVAAIVRPVPAPLPAPRIDLSTTLASLASDADPRVIRLAVQARDCAAASGDAVDARRLAVIDYSRPSTERRLWVFDLDQPRLLYSEYVAHGRNTGENFATRFSNDEGSLQSSLGLFRTAETYDGGNGYSMRMDGLEAGINDRARPRAIVMHGAPYVDPLQALRQGRLGRSLGCPALRPQVAREVIDTLKQGQLLFAYYPDHRWLDRSRYLSCRGHEPAAASRSALHATAG